MAGTGQFSYGTPTTTTSSATSGNPLQPVYQASPPQIAPTTSNYDVSPQNSLSQLTSANALANAQAYANLNNILASEGITGNDALAAQGALSGQLTAAQAPTLASLIQNAQGMGLGQSEFNAGAANQANMLNLQALMGVNSANQNAANVAANNLASLLENAYSGNLNAILSLLGAGLGGAQSINASGLSGQSSIFNAANNAANQNTSNFWNALPYLEMAGA